MLCKVLICSVILFITLQSVAGCRQEICRKRRAVVENEVTLQLQGCSGRTKPWLRQMSYCLNISTIEVAFSLRDWYEDTYQTCFTTCGFVRAGTQKFDQIMDCVTCFTSRLSSLDKTVSGRTIDMFDIENCIEQFVVPALSNELPRFTPISNRRGRVTLPIERPANDWWSITVRLPCKPPLFRFFNANCINAFAQDARSRDFVLAQNRLIFNDDITFLARFDDTCRFDIRDVEIVWDKSVPAFAFPQLSSLPISNSRRQPQFGAIFFDAASTAKLFMTDDGIPAELQSGRRSPKRKRRQTTEEELVLIANSFSRLGISMPCTVRQFSMTDNLGSPIFIRSNGRRHMVDILKFYQQYGNLDNNIRLDINLLNFTMDYGYDHTGCFFTSSDVDIVVNPPDDWVDGEERISCYTCIGAASDEECNDIGNVVLCGRGEICQSQIRHISTRSKVIDKRCKQSQACENNQHGNYRRQCKNMKQGSVCRCCCDSDFCNGDASHCL